MQLATNFRTKAPDPLMQEPQAQQALTRPQQAAQQQARMTQGRSTLMKSVQSMRGGGDMPLLPYPRQCDHIAKNAHRLFLSVSTFSLVVFVVWANVTVLDKVKHGSGKVVPQQQNQTVQHLEGGILKEILVKEGDRVEKGMPLLRIENSFSQAEFSSMQLDMQAKRLRISRLTAEARGDDRFEIAPDIQQDIPNLVEREKSLYESRKVILREQLLILNDQSRQKELELSELKSRWANTVGEREMVMKRVTSLRRLVTIGAVSSNEAIDTERLLQQTDGKISDLTHDIPRAESSLSELSRRRTEATLHFRSDAEKERSDVELQLAKLEESLSAMKDRSSRSEVMAPISGIVNKLLVSTIGGVVKSGEALIQIVPIDSSIAVEARLSPTDRAEVWPGLPAVIKVSAYDFSVYGGLKGKVVDVSADALQDERGQPYFRVRLEANANDFGPDRPVVPGMLADVDVLSGRETIMTTLLRPVRKLRDSALR